MMSQSIPPHEQSLSPSSSNEALWTLLKAMPSRLLLSATMLGLIAYTGQGVLPESLISLTTMLGNAIPESMRLTLLGIGSNEVHRILNQIMRGELSGEEIRRQMEQSIEKSGITEALSYDEFEGAMAQLLESHNIFREAMHENQQELLVELARQSTQHRQLSHRILQQISNIATREQSAEALVLLRRITHLVEQGHAQPHSKRVEIGDALREFDQLPLDEIPEITPLPSGSLLRLPPNPHFVGRKVDIQALAMLLKGQPSLNGIRPTVAVTGIGGIGKPHPT